MSYYFGGISDSLKNGNVAKPQKSSPLFSERQIEVLLKGRSKKNLQSVSSKSSKEQDEDRTLFVGNLPLNVTRKQVKTLFRRFGKVASVRLRSAVPSKAGLSKKAAVILRSYRPEKDSINAYVVMESVESTFPALAVNGTVFQEHHLRVDLAKKREYDGKTAVFVCNLPFGCQEEELYQFFGQDVASVRLVRDAETGICKGFGFVVFGSRDGVELALRLNGEEFGGRAIRVKRVKPKNSKQHFVGFRS